MKAIVLIFTVLSSLKAVNCFASSNHNDIQNGLSKVILNLLLNVHSGDYSAIEKLIPEDGFIVADSRIVKAQIVKDLRNPASYLINNMIGNETNDAIVKCEKKGKFKLVSFFALYDYYRENIMIQIRNEGNSYFASVKGESKKCKMWIFPLRFEKMGNKFFISSDLYR